MGFFHEVNSLSDGTTFFKGGGFEEIHCSAALVAKVNVMPKVPMNSLKFLDETIQYDSNVDLIQSILKQINDQA